MTTDPNNINDPQDEQDEEELSLEERMARTPHPDDLAHIPADSERGYELLERVFEDLMTVVAQTEKDVEHLELSPRQILDVLGRLSSKLEDGYIRSIYLHSSGREVIRMLHRLIDDQDKLPIPFDDNSVLARAYEQGRNARLLEILRLLTFEGQRRLLQLLDENPNLASKPPDPSQKPSAE